MKKIFYILPFLLLLSCTVSDDLDRATTKIELLESRLYKLELEQRYYKEYLQPVITSILNEIANKTGAEYPRTFEEWKEMKRLKLD